MVSSILSKKSILAITSLLLLATSNFFLASPAFARYEEKEGVFGEIKYVRICNQLGSLNQVQYKQKLVLEQQMLKEYYSKCTLQIALAFLLTEMF